MGEEEGMKGAELKYWLPPHPDIYLFARRLSCKSDELGLMGCRKSQGHRDGVLKCRGEEKVEIRAD